MVSVTGRSQPISLKRRLRGYYRRTRMKRTRFEGHAAAAPSQCSEDVQVNIVRAFRDLVERRYREGWPLARFAQELNVSLPALRSACMTVEGLTPGTILNERLIVEAKRSLVYSTMTVAQIAYRLGFDDPDYFIRFFSRMCKKSPTLYREHKLNPASAFRVLTPALAPTAE